MSFITDMSSELADSVVAVSVLLTNKLLIVSTVNSSETLEAFAVLKPIPKAEPPVMLKLICP